MFAQSQRFSKSVLEPSFRRLNIITSTRLIGRPLLSSFAASARQVMGMVRSGFTGNCMSFGKSGCTVRHFSQ